MHFKKDETPDRVHGRLLEAVHLSGYTADRAYDEIKWLLRQDRWKSVSPGFTDVHAFMASIDLAEYKFAVDQRKDIVQQLAALDAGQRATARLLGVSQKTVRRDLGISDLKESLDITETANGLSEVTQTLIESDSKESPIAPYYSEAGIEIYHGDCREILPSLARGLMVTDPPYNVGYHYNDYHDAMEPTDYWGFLSDHGPIVERKSAIHRAVEIPVTVAERKKKERKESNKEKKERKKKSRDSRFVHVSSLRLCYL